MNTARDIGKTGSPFIRFIGRALLAVAFSAAGLALPVGPALAGGQVMKPPSVTVHYARSRLDQAGYAVDLHARLSDAASQVCSESAEILAKSRIRGHQPIAVNRREADINRCMTLSMARAVADVSSPELEAVHEQSRKGTVRIAARR